MTEGEYMTDQVSAPVQNQMKPFDRSDVDNPIRLLADAEVVCKSDFLVSGDLELANVLAAARAQILIRPQDALAWSIIRLLLVDISEEQYRESAKRIRQKERE